MDWRKEKILITGGTGMVGRALGRELAKQGCDNIYSTGSADFNLKDIGATQALFEWVKPRYVFHLAAKVYGIGGNAAHKADVLFDNVMINTNVVELCRIFGVKKIVAMGSGCVYPQTIETPEYSENQIWLGEPHGSEDSYAHSKRLMLAQLMANKKQYDLNYCFAISGNLYGEYDRFNADTGHVIPSLIYKFYEAQKTGGEVVAWGSGRAVRDFTYSEDIARALICLMDFGEGAVNIGSGFIHHISEIIVALSDITGVSYKYNRAEPDGQYKRIYNLKKLKSYGFEPQVDLLTGLKKTYRWYCKNREEAKWLTI